MSRLWDLKLGAILGFVDDLTIGKMCRRKSRKGNIALSIISQFPYEKEMPNC